MSVAPGTLRQRAKQVFLAVLDEPRARWEPRIAELCADEPELRALVDELLHAHEAAGRLLDPLDVAVHELRPAAPANASLAAGEHIGSYRLVRAIGEGGFGVVFLAEQDEPIRRRVALKVIKPGMDSAQVAARFAAERQALALMDHPGIARVLDAGTTPSGRPFFVMEFVDGPHLTDYCDGQRLPVRERLELFHEVCLAVQHAHQKGVIHRDLKPSNVLVATVDGRPLPKVIDFGIAKAMGPALGGTSATLEGQVLGTPECMAPEQAMPGSEDVDTRADVYGLGVLLYRLLTGASPYDKDRLGGDLFAWARAIREDEPLRPSTRVRQLGAAAGELAAARHTTSERLPRLLRGELDWIVLRAMAKDRGRRYVTAAALAADVRRYLDDEPIEASPPSRLYRLGKLWRRHRAATLALAAVLVTAVAAAVISVRAAWQARQAQESADRQREVAEQQAYVANLLGADIALRGHDPLEARRCLEAAPGVRRGWEWHHLESRRDRSGLALRGGPGRPLAMATHPTRPLVVTTWEGSGMLRVFDLVSGETRAQLEAGADADRLVFATGGTAIAFGTMKGRVALWSWETGECRELAPHQGRVERVALDGQGKLLATASWDGTAALHDLEPPAVRHVLRHGAAVHLVAVSRDGRRVATASWDETLSLWDAGTGGLVKSQRVAHAWTPRRPSERFALGNVSALAFDPEGRRLAVAVRDARLLVLDAATGETIWSTDTHVRLVRSLDWSADGSRLAAASQDRRVTVWSPEGWKLVAELDHGDDVRAVTFTPDGRLLVSAGFDRAVRVWNASDGRPRGTLLGHEDGVFDAQFTADGRRLLTHSGDGTVRVWDPFDAARQALWGHACGVAAVAFAGEGRLVSAGGQDLRCWDLGSGEPLWIERLDPDVWLAAMASDASGDRLAAATSCGELRVRAASPGVAPPPVAAHQTRIRAVAFSPDRQRIATAADDDTARVFEARSGARLVECKGHEADLTGVAFALGGVQLVTASLDGTVRVWDAASGRFVRRLELGRRAGFEAVAVHPDGRQLALATDKSIVVTSLDPQARPRDLEGHSDTVRALAWLPDGSRLVSASRDRTVRVWHPKSGACLAILRGHERYILCLAVSPSGSRIAAGGEDGSVRVWELGGR